MILQIFVEAVPLEIQSKFIIFKNKSLSSSTLNYDLEHMIFAYTREKRIFFLCGELEQQSLIQNLVTMLNNENEINLFS